MTSFSESKASVTDRRRWQVRHECRINARLGMDGHETGCQILNISAGGAGITFDPVLRPATGSRVYISSKEIGTVTCTVQWVSGSAAGLAFDDNGRTSGKVRDLIARLAGEVGV